MKKSLLVVLMVLVLVAVLFSCTKNNGQTTDTTVADTTAAEQATTVADTTVAEVTVAETTVAETTVAETTVAETTVAETTVAETTVEETTVEEETTMGDTSKTFASDLASQTVGKKFGDSDLKGFFTCELPTGGSVITESCYQLDGISDMYADMDGKYVYTVDLSANMEGCAGCAYVFVRGDKSVVPVGFEADIDHGWYRINNYYETAGLPHEFAGSSGIGVNVANGTLTLIIKYVNREAKNYIGNAVYTYDIGDATRIKFVDNDEKVDIYAGVTLVTSIVTSDVKSYDDIVASTGVAFAGKVTFTDADGKEVVINDTLVAGTAKSQIGLVARAANLYFTSVQVEGLSTARLPGEPVRLFTAEDLLEAATNGTTSSAMEFGEFTPGYKSVYLKFNGGGDNDPWFFLANSGVGARYALIKYNADVDGSGELFVGSEGNPHGGDSVLFNYTAGDGYVIVDLCNSPAYNGTDIAYLRFDFTTGNPINIRVYYIGLFETAEEAEMYYEKSNVVELIDRTDANADFKAWSFDTFYVNTDASFYFGSDGQSDQKLAAIDNTVPFAFGEEHTKVAFRGWIGFGQPIASFGYYVDDNAIVYGDYTQATEAGVLAAAGTDDASRFCIWAMTDTLGVGDHKVGAVAKLADGRVVRLYEITVSIAAPTAKEDVADFKGVSCDDMRAIYNEDECKLTVHAWGWVALTQNFESFGYTVDDGKIIFLSADWIHDAEGAVVDAVTGLGGTVATRFSGDAVVDLTGYAAGTHSVKYLCKLADGTIFYFYEKTFEIPEADPTKLNIRPFQEAVDELGGIQSTDSYYENGVLIASPSASKWMGGQKPDIAPGDRINGITGVDNATFYGWVGLGEHTIGGFGYQIAGYDPVWVDCSGVETTDDVRTAGGANALRYSMTVDFTGITEPGIYNIIFFVKDAVTGKVYQIDKWNIATIVKYVVPFATRPDGGTASTKEFGTGGQGAALVSTQPFGYKFTLAEGEFLDLIHIYNMATYDAPDTVGTFKLYKWDTDYDTTVAAGPVYTEIIANHGNCTPLDVTGFSVLNVTNGEYLFVLQPTVGSWTPWGAAGGNANGTPYINGAVGSDFLASYNVTTAQ